MVYIDYLSHTLQEWYEHAIKSQYFQSANIRNCDIQTLFNGKNSKNLIRNCIKEWTELDSRDEATQKIYSLISDITDFRSQHTVSAFLLGIIVKNSLSLDVQCRTADYDELSLGDASFSFLWPIVCLMHDIGYKFERRPKIYLEKFPSLEAFCNGRKIDYNLLNQSKRAELLINYYEMRADKNEDLPKIDHGITGGILLYDALMTFYSYGGLSHLKTYNGEIYSTEEFPKLALAISEAVALHNMWVADTTRQELYKRHHLEELILDGSGLDRKFYEDDSLQFFLGFIDTIDPIKAFCNTEGGAKHMNPKQLLQDFNLRFQPHTYSLEAHLVYENSLLKKYFKTVKGMEDWLGVFVNPLDYNGITVNIPSRQEFINTKKDIG